MDDVRPLKIHFLPPSGHSGTETACARLEMFNEPYWYSDAGQEKTFEWDWLHLLTYLSENWKYLLFEESYPIDGLKIRHPGDLYDDAEKRWSETMDDARLTIEEEIVFAFWYRHNMAYAMSDAGVPALVLMKNGLDAFVVDSKNECHTVTFESLKSSLIAIGDAIAKYYRQNDRSDQHITSALQAWENRDRMDHAQALAIRTGLSENEFDKLNPQARAILSDSLANDHDNSYLAAARMSRGYFAADTLNIVLPRLHELSETYVRISDDLKSISDAATNQLNLISDERPYIQGQKIAKRIRERLNLAQEAQFDVEEFLAQNGVVIDNVLLNSASISALCIWGTSHVIILTNSHKNSRNQSPQGRRSTLAHELCHILVDRTHALPVAEVLNGDVDLTSEQRANAFAAEILAPLTCVEDMMRNSPDGIEQTIYAIAHHFHVGKPLIAWQITNSTSYEWLDSADKIIVQQCTN